MHCTWLISSSCSLDISIKSDSSSSLRAIFLSVSYKVLVRSFTCRTKVGSACSITRRRPVRTRLLILCCQSTFRVVSYTSIDTFIVTPTSACQRCAIIKKDWMNSNSYLLLCYLIRWSCKHVYTTKLKNYHKEFNRAS